MSKLLLVAPAGLEVQGVRGKHVHHLNLGILAALGEKYFTDIEIAEEEFSPIDLNQTPDLVGMTMMTCQAPRGYWLADHFRKKGSKVIMGGSHTSFRLEEGLRHADAVVNGEVEDLWPQIMQDFSGGKLEGKVYHADTLPDLAKIPMPRKDLFFKTNTTFNAQVIQSGRGCPLGCKFCTVTQMYGKTFRTRPVEHIVEEIKRFPSDVYFFVDDNIFFSHKYAYELFEALLPLKIKWGSQASLELICRDEELLKLCAKSGCISLFVGFESIDQATLNGMHKSFNKVHKYEQNIKKIQDAGINVVGAFIFGFENDTPATFKQTLDFVMKSKLAMVNTGVMTPFPGTEVFDTLEKAGKIFDHDYEHYTGGNMVWKHPNFNQEEMDRLYYEFRHEFYSLGSIARRFWANRRQPLYYLVMNFAHYWRTHHRKQGRQFDVLKEAPAQKLDREDMFAA
ncbi:MAG: radical SAM protein [Bdellovibrionota bacterium]